MAGFKERAKDFGRVLIGEGEQVRYRRDSERYAATNGVSIEKAQKAIYLNRLDSIKAEITLNGTIDSRSPEFAEFIAASKELLGPETLAQSKKDAEDPTKYTSITPAPTTGAGLERVKKYYKDKYESHFPKPGVIKDIADTMGLVQALTNRLSRRIGTASNIQELLTNNPQASADLGKLILAQEHLQRHERRFSRELAYEKRLNQFGKDAKDSLAKIAWQEPSDWFASSYQNLRRFMNNPSMDTAFSGAINIAGSTAKFLAKEGLVTAKLLFSGVATGASYINSRRE
jgi:hypothetical protein